jgi:hypothetical protein
MVIKLAWRLPTQSFRRAETYAGLKVNLLFLLSDFNQNLNVFKYFSKSSK